MSTFDGEHLSPDVARDLLDAFRWHADQQVINHDGEHVWLGPCLNANGVRVGITDCCHVAEPCEHHARLAASL